MRTIEEIIERNIELGEHFFDDNAMKFFSSEIHPNVYGDFFVTSETPPNSTKRCYTVRYIDWEIGRIETYGYFMGFDSLMEAELEAECANSKSRSM